MRKIVSILCLPVCLFVSRAFAGDKLWQRAANRDEVRADDRILPEAATFKVNEIALRSRLFSLSVSPKQSQVIELPMPDGQLRAFKVWATPILPDELAVKYPELKTFTAIAVDDAAVTAKLDITLYGFHAMIYDGDNTTLIDPSGNDYAVHYKRNEGRIAANRMSCEVLRNTGTSADMKTAQRTSNGYQLRTYRLALSCDHQYAEAATGITSPTKAQVLSKMVISMNRINGVYERELSVSMVFIAKEDTLIFPSAFGDPFGNDNSNATALLFANQKICDSLVGNANYDMGHIFTTGGGGLSQLGVVCKEGYKAQSVTGSAYPLEDGFDIDYVAHEMGHEFGADHTFNDNINKSCQANAVADLAYEPGSGSTIMAYAGICGPDNIQAHSDAYFAAVSLVQIQHYINVAEGNTCGVKTATGNKLVGLAPFSASYTIPYYTPFELTGPTAVDSVGDTLITYCWEQHDLGDFGKTLVTTHNSGPIFRSYLPVKSPTRTFPAMKLVRDGILNDVGTDNAQGEKVPDVARTLNFKLTMRNVLNGNGCFLFPDDSIHLDVANTGLGRGFAVTSQNTAGNTYRGGSTQHVTWDVAGSDQAPVSASFVDIFLSPDGGYTWPYVVGTFPNTGAADVLLPNPDTTATKSRIKVKGSGNVFFNINGKDFTVIHNDTTATDVQVFPSPVHHTLHVYPGNVGFCKVIIYNAIGQQVWDGEFSGQLDIPVDNLDRGMYILRLKDAKGKLTIRKFIVS